MVALGGVAVSYERGTPVNPGPQTLNAERSQGRQVPLSGDPRQVIMGRNQLDCIRGKRRKGPYLPEGILSVYHHRLEPRAARPQTQCVRKGALIKNRKQHHHHVFPSVNALQDKRT